MVKSSINLLLQVCTAHHQNASRCGSVQDRGQVRLQTLPIFVSTKIAIVSGEFVARLHSTGSFCASSSCTLGRAATASTSSSSSMNEVPEPDDQQPFFPPFEKALGFSKAPTGCYSTNTVMCRKAACFRPASSMFTAKSN